MSGHKFTFLTGNNGRKPNQPMYQPEATERTDMLLTKLSERKGKLYAELVFFLLSIRLRVATEHDKETSDALASMAARLVGAVTDAVYDENADAVLVDLMKDSDAITDEVLPLLRK